MTKRPQGRMSGPSRAAGLTSQAAVKPQGNVIQPVKQPLISRGYLQPEDDPEDVFVFQYNPNSIQQEGSTKYNHQEVPWISHPIPQFQNGDKEPIRFRLEMRDKCRSENEPNQIRAAYAWLNSRRVPTRDNSQKMIKQPSLLFLVVGGWTERVRIERVRLDVYEFHPDFSPKQANIDVELFVSIAAHRNPQSILQRYGVS